MTVLATLACPLAVAQTASPAGQAPMEAPALELRVGDIVNISLPGDDAFNKDFQVDRSGNLLLPEVGEISVLGLTESETQELLRARLALVYHDVSRFQLTTKERRLLVTVLGYVKEPGPVNLPTHGNVQTAINAAGGLVPGAQLDRMQVRRGEELLSFNYKEYLDTGDQQVLPELLPLDVVFVPASPLIGNVQVEFDAATLVAGGDGGEDKTSFKVFGEVNNPGLFSYKNGATVVDLLMRAGGVTRYAGVEQIRVISDQEPLVFDLKAYLDSGDQALLPKMSAGTTIFVPTEVDEVKAGKHTVYVMGEVFKPGAFESKPGAGFLDILANAGGPTRFAETRQIHVLRADGRVDPFDLQAYTQGLPGSAAPVISPGDAIFVPERTDFNEKSWLKVSPNRAIRIMGAVNSPGRYEWSDEMSLLDLLAHAGGPTAKADSARIQVVSNGEGGPAITSEFDLEHFVTHGGSMDSIPRLQAGFTIVVPELPQDPRDNKSQWIRQPSEESIYIFGQVGAPGRYRFNDSMHFLDILSAADGPTNDADLHNIRVAHRNGTRARVSPLNLARYFETGDETLLPRVLPGDSIYIPDKERNWLEESTESTVRVLGAVSKPGRYRFDDQMTLLDLLAESGGPTSDAYLEKVVVVNSSCCENRSTTFDLLGFVKNPDSGTLPVVRAGDTVFVPDLSASHWNVFMENVRDVFQIVAVIALLAAL
jgi:protein involved in polysaccharide export with SLBB domain